jgi:hypothetical protein
MTARKTPLEVVEDTPTPVEEGYEPPTDPSPDEDIERILPGPGEPVTLESGTLVFINPLKLREFLAMLKIVTRGAAMALGSVQLDVTDEAFGQSMISLFLFAIPEAEEEAVDFVRLMVRPYGPHSGAFGSDEELIRATRELDIELDNPSLEDLFTIIEVVINRESKDLRRLGKRLSNALAYAQKTGQV